MLRDLIPSRQRSATRSENDPFSGFRRAMDRMVDEHFGDLSDLSPARWSESLRAFTPRLDLEEQDDRIVLSAELPGIAEEDVEIEVSRDMLTIKGEKKSEHEEKGKNRYTCERSYGSFERTMRLPAEIDRSKIVADMKNGVLTVTLPKSAEAKKDVKKIPVRH